MVLQITLEEQRFIWAAKLTICLSDIAWFYSFDHEPVAWLGLKQYTFGFDLEQFSAFLPH